MAMLMFLRAMQIVVLTEMIYHDVRYFHLVLRTLHRSVEVHIWAGRRGVMMIVETAVQYYAADWSIDQAEADG